MGRAGSRLPGVVGAAPGALLPQHVEPYARGRAAVVAQDPYHLFQVDVRHRRRRNLLIELPPCGRHVAGRPRTHWARVVVVRSHLVHALQMNRVPALKHTDVLCGVEQILKAYRAVVMHCSFHTAVGILQDVAVATPTFVAVKKVICATSSAYATSITVVLALGDVIIEEFAFFTEVFSHAGPTVRAVLLHILFFGAERADHLFYFVAWDLVAIARVDLERVLGVVVAMAAAEDLAAAGRDDGAPAPVVRAAALRPC